MKKHRKITYLAILIAFISSLFFLPVYNTFRIQSHNMEPALKVGDRLIAEKYIYSKNKPLSRGTIIVYQKNNYQYVKRIIGLPKETIKIKNGRVSINGNTVKREYVKQYSYDNAFGKEKHVKVYKEIFSDTIPHIIYEQTDQGRYDNTKVYSIPEGHYFVMGDNRDNSLDSRNFEKVGFIPEKDITYIPFSTTFSLYNCNRKMEETNCNNGFAFERFFKAIN